MGLSQFKQTSIRIEGDPIHNSAEAVVTPGVEQTLISYLVPVGKVHNLHQVVLSCRVTGSFRVEIDGSLMGSGRTGAASPNSSMSFVPTLSLSEGTLVEVKYCSAAGSLLQRVEAYAQAAETDS